MNRPASRIPADWGDSPDFVFGNRDAFKDYAGSDALPRWLRVTYAAYGHVSANGHATFRPGELAAILGEKVEGVWSEAPRQRVYEAIQGAKERGLLLAESKARCLVVPAGIVHYGKGKAGACRLHRPKRMNDETVSSGPETTRFLQVISAQDERRNRVVSRSAPSPLSPNATELGTQDAS